MRAAQPLADFGRDWIAMCAYSISNAVDRAHREEREEMYLTLRKKYTEAPKRRPWARCVGMAVAELDEKPDQDLLGEIFYDIGPWQ